MSIEQGRRDVAALNAAYQRDIDAIGKRYAAAYAGFDAEVSARQAQQRAAVDAVARREKTDRYALGAYLSRPGLDQLRFKFR